MTFEFRSADGRSDRLSRWTEMARAKPGRDHHRIWNIGGEGCEAATSTIPIVFTSVGDPVGAGLVAS